MNSRKNIVFFCIWVARPRHLDRWRLGETRAGTSGGEVFWGIRRRVSKHGRASIICNIQSSESSTLHSICDWLMGDLQFIQASIQNKHGWSSDTWRTLPCIIWTGPKWKVSIRYSSVMIYFPKVDKTLESHNKSRKKMIIYTIGIFFVKKLFIK